MSDLHDLFKKDGFRPRKTAGQNFLVDRNILSQIDQAIEVPPGDVLMEVGGGTGALTEKLVKKNRPLLVVEPDHKLHEYLERRFKGQGFMRIIKEDILRLDFAPFVPPPPALITLAGNIPYYLTTPLITRLLEREGGRIRSIYLMIQREVAERLAAKPGTKAWGALSVCARYYADFKVLFPVSRRCFRPAPKVESAFVRIIPKKKLLLGEEDTKNLFRTVRAIFQTRRKTLFNSIRSGGWDEPKGREALKACRLEAMVRGETLDLDRLIELSLALGPSRQTAKPEGQ
jgi:16S rRNA (adenine1518-N6/adenine1519-N6)-dimethyltransferase